MKLIYDIQRELEIGNLSFYEIARKFEVSVSDVEMVAQELDCQVIDNDYLDDYDYQD